MTDTEKFAFMAGYTTATKVCGPVLVLAVLLGASLTWSPVVFADDKEEAPKQQSLDKPLADLLLSVPQEMTQAMAAQILQPYLGQWVQIEARVGDVYVSGSVLGYITSTDGEGSVPGGLEFVSDQEEKVLQLKKHDRIVVRGRTKDLKQNSYQLSDCELLGTG